MSQVLIIALIFFCIGFIFSMLGMGGSQLYIPLLYWLGLDFKTEAIPLGMFLNLVNSITATVNYGRKKLIEWRVALPFGIMMVIFAPIGTAVNISLPTEPIIIIFAIFTAAAGLYMMVGKRKSSVGKEDKGRIVKRKAYIMGLIGGSFLGFTAGLIGRGGGSFIVPLLYIVAGLEPKVAAATSAAIVTFSGGTSLISHIIMGAKIDPFLWILCASAVFLGSFTGSRFMSTRLDKSKIKNIFGIILLGISAILIISVFTE